jgi:hypothetical protein
MDNNALAVMDAAAAEIPGVTRETAFEYWDGLCRHNYAELARKSGLNEHTLRTWGRRDNWQLRSYERNIDVAPEELRHVTGINLQQAALECSRWLLNVAAGRLDPNRAKGEMCRAICHMAGWSPTHYLPMREKTPPARRTIPDLDTMTDDQLLELERELSGA